jgi:hypothetical protein
MQGISIGPIINVESEYGINTICLWIEGKYLIDGVYDNMTYKSGWYWRSLRENVFYRTHFRRYNIAPDINGSNIKLKEFSSELCSIWRIIVGIVRNGKKLYYEFSKTHTLEFDSKTHTVEFYIDITIGKKYPIIKLNGNYADRWRSECIII